MSEKMNEDDRRRKREKNNESVRKCRMNEKLKIQTAQEELIKYKKEYQELVDKYSSLQKELGTLRSLFQGSMNTKTTAESATTSQTIEQEKSKQSIVNNKIISSDDTCSDLNINQTCVGIELDEILKNGDFLLDFDLNNQNLNVCNQENSNQTKTIKRKLDDL